MDKIYLIMEAIESNEGFAFEELWVNRYFKTKEEAELYQESSPNRGNLFIKTIHSFLGQD